MNGPEKIVSACIDLLRKDRTDSSAERSLRRFGPICTVDSLRSFYAERLQRDVAFLEEMGLKISGSPSEVYQAASPVKGQDGTVPTSRPIEGKDEAVGAVEENSRSKGTPSIAKSVDVLTAFIDNRSPDNEDSPFDLSGGFPQGAK